MAGYSVRQCPNCNETKKFRKDCLTCGCVKSAWKGKQPAPAAVTLPPTPQQQVDLELEKLRVKKEGGNEKISILQERVLQLEKEKDALLSISKATPQIIDVVPKAGANKSESAAVLVWSDWHIEEEVRAEEVSNKNEFNLEVGDRRFANLLHGGLAWYKIESQKTTIKTIVIAALGDFITGSIHEDLAESNLLPPVEAIYKAQGMLISGIKFMLENTP